VLQVGATGIGEKEEEKKKFIFNVFGLGRSA
jgi:hypothetical protein